MFDWLLDHSRYHLAHCHLRTGAFLAAVGVLGLVVFLAPSVSAASFPDVPVSHPNAAAIDYLTTEGVIGGYPDGTFRPDQPVNRAEALKIILLGSGISVLQTSAGEFPDVPDNAWFADFVATAYDREVVAGYPDGFFRPEQTVNLVEALKISLAANDVQLENYATDEQLFADSDVAAWYNSFLNYAHTFDLIEVHNNRVEPATPLTRGRLAEIIYRFANRIDRVCPHFYENTKHINADYFDGITLTSALPNVFFENEVFTIVGTLADEAQEATVFYFDDTGAQTAFSGEVVDGSFSIPISFHQPGLYELFVTPGTAGRNFVIAVEVLPRECVPATVELASMAPMSVTVGIESNEPIIRWDAATENIARVVIRQDDRRYERIVTAGARELVLTPADFATWETGAASLQVFLAGSEHGWSYEPRTRWAGSDLMTIQLAQHAYAEYRTDAITIDTLPSAHTRQELSFNATAVAPLNQTAFLIRPDGIVEEFDLPIATDPIPAQSSFPVVLDLPMYGTYILEINDTNNLAALNYPIYEESVLPVLPDFADLASYELQPERRLSVNRERAIWLRLINAERVRYGVPAVSLDSDLVDLAQNYAEHMVADDFFGHVDPDGHTPDDRRRTAGISLPVGENLAKNVATDYAHEGLMRSAAHRANILNPAWRYVGLGVAQNKNGELFFVQEFTAAALETEALTDVRIELLTLLNTARGTQQATPFMLDDGLTAVAQNWSNRMVADDFFAFEYGDASIEADISTANQSGSFSTFIAAADSFDELILRLQDDDSFFDLDKIYVAIGIAQADTGAYRATFIFR